MAAVAESALSAQFLPDLARKLAWGLYGKNAHSAARKRPASKIRIGIEGSKFEPLLERLHRTFEDLRRYAAGLSLLLVLMTAVWNLIRLWSSVTYAGVLQKYAAWPGPVYIGITGAVFAGLCAVVLWGLWRRSGSSKAFSVDGLSDPLSEETKWKTSVSTWRPGGILRLVRAVLC